MRASSSVDREYPVNLRNVFSVFETISEDSKRKSFRLDHSFFTCRAVDQNS